MRTPVYLHVDMDAFYASVEQHDQPELSGKPVIVGARPGQRGVVSACSYEARVFGVHSAMPVSEAYRLCPDGIFVPVRMKRYQEVSREIMSILAEFTPDLQQMSVDEAFLDLTGTERLLGPPLDTARTIKRAVREATGLTISVGIAPSKYLAKLASDRNKPDGLCVVEPGSEENFVAELPLRALWGVGKKTLSELNATGIGTVMELRACAKSELASFFGATAAEYLYAVCRGIDPGLYGERPRSHSISGERTFASDVKNSDAILRVLLETAQSCIYRMMDEGARSRTVTVKLRLADFTTYTLRRTLDHDVTTADELYAVARELFAGKWDRRTPVRLIGCGLGNVESGEAAAQGELFDQSSARRRRAEEAVFSIRKRGLPIKKARLLDQDGPRGHAPDA
jgi:DNA polymerase-4